MRIALKTSIALVITAMVPIVVFFLIGSFLGLSATFAGVLAGKFQGKLDNMLISAIWWPFICIILVGPISFGHVFFIGLPALVVSWRLRIIRWWSTLIMSFLIGAIPSTIYIFFFQDIGWDEREYFYQSINILSLGITASAALIMGFFGLSGGFAFWLLWRYWVSPSSPNGRLLSGLQDVENTALIGTE
jgi:hypothetical protein